MLALVEEVAVDVAEVRLEDDHPFESVWELEDSAVHCRLLVVVVIDVVVVRLTVVIERVIEVTMIGLVRIADLAVDVVPASRVEDVLVNQLVEDRGIAVTEMVPLVVVPTDVRDVLEVAEDAKVDHVAVEEAGVVVDELMCSVPLVALKESVAVVTEYVALVSEETVHVVVTLVLSIVLVVEEAEVLVCVSLGLQVGRSVREPEQAEAA